MTNNIKILRIKWLKYPIYPIISSQFTISFTVTDELGTPTYVECDTPIPLELKFIPSNNNTTTTFQFDDPESFCLLPYETKYYKFNVNVNNTRQSGKFVLQVKETSSSHHPDPIIQQIINITNEPLINSTTIILKSISCNLPSANPDTSLRQFKINNNNNNNNTHDIFIPEKMAKKTVIEGYGTQIWNCSIFFMAVLLQNPQIIQSRNVLELGSGCGLLGKTIAAMGIANQIVCTEMMGESLDFLSQTINECNKEFFNNLSARELTWGKSNIIVEKTCTPLPDVIIGADLLYNPKIYPQLLQTLSQFTELKPNIDIYIAYKPREPPQEEIQHFINLAQQSHGLTCRIYCHNEFLNLYLYHLFTKRYDSC